MHRIVLLSLLLVSSVVARAQKSFSNIVVQESATETAAKGTGITDTLVLSNIDASNTARVLYRHTGSGSGYVSGMNSYGDRGFAERYFINGNDSSVQVLGVMAQFGGTVTATSTKSIRIYLWNQGERTPIATHLTYDGVPVDPQDSVDVPFTQLGIGPTSDTLKAFYFPFVSSWLVYPFFVGYKVEYNYAALDGDTIALASSEAGTRTFPYSFLENIQDSTGAVIAVDTVLPIQNATMWSDLRWHDNYTQNDSLFNDLAIFPIVVIGNPASVHGVERGALVLNGVYPNPATNEAHIAVTLKTATTVTVQLADMNGHFLSTNVSGYFGNGKHEIAVPTSCLPAGNYLYIVTTGTGDKIAGVLNVTH